MCTWVKSNCCMHGVDDQANVHTNVGSLVFSPLCGWATKPDPDMGKFSMPCNKPSNIFVCINVKIKCLTALTLSTGRTEEQDDWEQHHLHHWPDRERNAVFFKHSGIIRVGTWLWYSLESFLKCYHRLLKSKGWMNWVINWFLSFTSTSAQVCLLSTSTQTKIRGNQRAVAHCYEEPPCAKAAVEWFDGECRFAILLWVVMEALW